ncbi:hypothetical protein NXF25_002858 [Crotalus adamanteus]|uniref:Uncharacterized protein n=1 Tax=Crotalus adamanteus TaxID=8729 RepID=A0AAW1CBL1_CROAD
MGGMRWKPQEEATFPQGFSFKVRRVLCFSLSRVRQLQGSRPPSETG